MTTITRTANGERFTYTLDGAFDGETHTGYVIHKASKINYPFARITLCTSGEMITFHKTRKAAERGPSGPAVLSGRVIEITEAE
jgi:hypothetical protein